MTLRTLQQLTQIDQIDQTGQTMKMKHLKKERNQSIGLEKEVAMGTSSRAKNLQKSFR